MAGLLDPLKQWMTPERAAAMQGIGQGLSQLAYGQPVDMSPAYEALQQRRDAAQMRKVMDVPGIMERFTPEQQAVLASMPESLATKIIMEAAFAPPPPGPEPIKGVEINGQLVNPITGELIGDFRTAGGEELPAGVQEIQWAAQQLGLVPGTPEYAAYIREQTAKTPLVQNNLGPTGIDYGKPGDGLVWQRDAAGNVVMDSRGAPIAIPFQGGPVWRSNEEVAASAADAIKKAEERDKTKAVAGNVVLQDIGRMKSLIKDAPWYSPAAGFGAETMAGIGGTAASDAKGLATTIRANIGFDRLQRMREESPTGGALGQVAVQELEALQATLGNLSQSQSPDQVLENLDRLEKLYTGILEKIYATGDPAAFGLPDAAVKAPSDMSDDEFLKALGFD